MLGLSRLINETTDHLKYGSSRKSANHYCTQQYIGKGKAQICRKIHKKTVMSSRNVLVEKHICYRSKFPDEAHYDKKERGEGKGD